MTIWQKFLLIIFLGTVVLYSINQISQTDTFYHLKTGQYILESKTVPTTDIYSLSAAGNLWIPHEWLSQVIFYLVYAVFPNFWALVIFAALLSALSYYLILRLSIKNGANFYIAAIIILILGFLTRGLWVPRPQIFGYLFLVILIYLLESHRRSPNIARLIAVVLLMWLWANMHASFVLGLVVFLFYFIIEELKFLFPNFFGLTALSKKHIFFIGVGFLGSIGFSLVNPGFYKTFFYQIYANPTASLFNIPEWKPITDFLYAPEIKIFIAILIAANAFLVWYFGFKKSNWDIAKIGLVLGISILPFISIRHAGFFPLIVSFPLILGISGFLRSSDSRIGIKQLSALFLLIVAAITSYRFFSFKIPNEAINGSLVPVAAVDFIQKNNLSGPIFNLYNEGGYLIWKLWPKEKIFIDSRSEIYRGESLSDFITILYQKPGWEKLVDEKYRLNLFLLTYQPIPTIGSATLPLEYSLLKKGFHLVYWDENQIILVRDTPDNSKVIEKFGLKHVNPYRKPVSIPKEDTATATIEMNSLLQRFPNSPYIQEYGDLFFESR